ncbi:tRNA (adenosine(37)-N6)-dimethylallyltransferase MiaA [Acuticoccus sp. M5D2P5]|uniref:tRNA (adenosine(37)-N6)-dimethylallyltransferase MiaA n=1 Tax=Acuticoccus kalidii TaxID=2910977 RepID=UPI001EFFBB51|nr:tRNA (adenosine(37)-N6)-dimethylallyltransferase MiaA [Acuticoccus kalidii]MCF3933809.1 tRNA (adenosine(37)-N6)-dimethylallyltransferase MiaA [Acuticoccus kalidii]
MTSSMAVVIAGPTASGKSRLAVALAEACGGTVINADAMQVYRDLAVVTARPSPADEAAVPHTLFGHVDGAEAHSVAAWLSGAEAAIAAARAAGRPPVVVGGTGLYLAALTEGLSPIPPVPDAVRDHWRARQGAEDPAALHAELARRDAAMAARLRPSDPQRIVRALEVIDATGRSLADWQAERSTPILPAAGTTAIVIAPERAALRAQIAERFDAMMTEGAREEVAALARRGLDPALPVMKAIGVPPLMALERGEIAEAEAVARAITESRQYAKRQETWFRHRFPDWRRFPTADEAIAALVRA